MPFVHEVGLQPIQCVGQRVVCRQKRTRPALGVPFWRRWQRMWLNASQVGRRRALGRGVKSVILAPLLKNARSIS